MEVQNDKTRGSEGVSAVNWNFDMSQAPRGLTEKVTRIVGKEERVFETFVPERILAASKDGKVYATHWIPPRLTASGAVLDGDRWTGFNRGDEPEAWAPWPNHPYRPQ